MRPFPWKCGNCLERAVNPAVLDPYSTIMEHDGRKHTVTLEEFSVLKCGKCGEITYDDESRDRLDAALREAEGLLTPQEIRQKRTALKLTQKQLAEIFEIAEATISRWECGGQIQQRVMDRFLRAYFDVPALREYWGAVQAAIAPATEAPSATQIITSPTRPYATLPTGAWPFPPESSFDFEWPQTTEVKEIRSTDPADSAANMRLAA